MGLEIETSTASVLDRNNPAWDFYSHSQERFGEDEVIVVALEAEHAFDPRTLSDVYELTRAFEQLPGVRRVDSLESVPLVRVEPDGVLNLNSALQGGPGWTASEAVTIADRVRADRIAPGSLVSRDGRVLAMNVLLEEDSEERYPDLVRAIREAIDDRRAWISGVPVFRVATDAQTRHEVLFFVPATVSIIALFLFLVFGRLQAVVIPLFTGGMGSLALLGIMAASGAPLTVTTAILPSVLLALGCAYVMHLLTAAQGMDDREAVKAAIAPVAAPIGLSGLTTAIGFAAIASVQIDAIRYVGGFGALGVVVVCFASLSAAPAALTLWPMRAGNTELTQYLRGPVARGLVVVAGRRSVPSVWAWLIAMILAGVGVWRLDVATDVTRWFPEGNPVRDAWDTIGSRLSGLSPMNVVIESRDGSSAMAPRVLRKIDELSRYLEELPEVGKTISVADPLRQIHGGFSGDPRAPLPQREDLSEQYLMLLESVPHMADLITDQRDAANIILRVDNNSSDALREVAQKVDRWWDANGVEGFSARTTGTMFEFARSEDAIAQGQLVGLFYAVGAIGGVLLLIFRRPLLVGCTLLVNFGPVGLLFGLMGLLGIPLDAGTVLVGSLALGIAVDDTIHVVGGFHSLRRRGESHRRAVEETFHRVLPPLVYTTVAVSLGFAILAFSPFTFTRNLGALTSAVMVICLAADLNLLPALLLRLRDPTTHPAGS
jgi:predicted RND superfamily exporter protein